MPDLLKLWKYILSYWERKSTIILLIFVVFFGLSFFFSNVDFTKISIVEMLVIVFVCLIIWIFWYYSNKIPRCPKGYNGIVIAISSENEDQCLKNDFVKIMQEMADNAKKIHIIVLPESASRSIVNAEQAVQICKKTKSVLIIWGDSRIRNIKEKEMRLLRLNTAMIHNPIPNDVSQQLGSDMAAIIPSKISCSTQNDCIILEHIANYINLGAKYFISQALLFNNDLSLAKQYLTELHSSPCIQLNKMPFVNKLRELIVSSLSTIYEIESFVAYQNWKKFHCNADIENMKILIKQHQDLCALDYPMKLLYAIYLFISNRKVDTAIKTLRDCKKITDDYSWCYSLAFLYAYKNNLRYASQFYKKAFRGNIAPSAILDIEEFILYVIDQEPHKYQLYYCLGIICFYIKMDFLLAEEYLIKFITVAGNHNAFAKECMTAQEIINQIHLEPPTNSVCDEQTSTNPASLPNEKMVFQK